MSKPPRVIDTRRKPSGNDRPVSKSTQRRSPEQDFSDDYPRSRAHRGSGDTKRGPRNLTLAVLGVGALAIGATTCGGPVKLDVMPDVNISVLEARTEVEQVEPTRVLPFQPGASTCFGIIPKRISTENKRINEIPLPLFPDIPLPDDVYRMSSIVLSELCMKGFSNFGPDAPIRSETREDGTVIITVDQSKGAIFMNRPAIDARTCTRDEEKGMNETGGRFCIIVTGEDSLGTDIIEWLPFTKHGDYLLEELLAYTQVLGYDPTCIQEALKEIPMSILLLNAFREQAEVQGFDASKLLVVLLDVNGLPTQDWDSSEQFARFETEFAEFTERQNNQSSASFELGKCDTREFGAQSDPHIVIETDDLPLLNSEYATVG